MLKLDYVTSKDKLSNEYNANDGLNFFVTNILTEYNLTLNFIEDFKLYVENFFKNYIFNYIIFTISAFSIFCSITILIIP